MRMKTILISVLILLLTLGIYLTFKISSQAKELEKNSKTIVDLTMQVEQCKKTTDELNKSLELALKESEANIEMNERLLLEKAKQSNK